MPQRWHVLYTKPNAEYVVADHLERQGIPVFLPTVRSVRPRRGYQTVPLFPSYVFFQADMDTFDMSVLHLTPGFRYIVKFDDRPATLPHSVIEFIRRKVAEINGQGGVPTHDFKPGDKLIIRSGPMAGLLAVFEGPMGPAERVQVLVEFLGRLTRAEIPVEQLEKTDPAEIAHLFERMKPRKRRRRTRGKGRRIRYKNAASGAG